jgi:hypothetical protein
MPSSFDASPIELARQLESFLAENPSAALMEDGTVLFEMASAKYALSSEHGRCLLHLWSEERNLVRTVVGLELRKDKLCIQVRRLGASRPQSLQFVANLERRSPSTRAAARRNYVRLLERYLIRHYADYKLRNLHAAMDLEKSFGPAYARGLLTRGRESWAVIGVAADETQSTIDGILTVGILWLAHCRERSGSSVCRGLKVFVPKGASGATQNRMAWLNAALGAWELYELSEAGDDLQRIDTSKEGNLNMRIMHAFDSAAAIERARSGLERLQQLLPEAVRGRVSLQAKSPNEVAASLYGLELARVKQGFAAKSFSRQDDITFGTPPNETVLTEESESWFQDLAARIFHVRYPTAKSNDPLFRARPEAWLETVLRTHLTELEPQLESRFVYAQVPAFSAHDRSVLDLLTATRHGRLAVLEVKADEDIHLPLQGLDYWIRVRKLNGLPANQSEGNFTKYGYFPGIVLVQDTPLLYFVVPALRTHSSLETVLAHISPEIAWIILALNEGWRSEPKVVYRKRSLAFPV